MKTKVLWVEDSAGLELRNLLAPILVGDEIVVNLAEDATSAVRYILTKEYDALVLDMRIPPGMDDYWIKMYRERGEDKADARLGLEIANWLCNGQSAFTYARPIWATPHRVGIFTVENDPILHERLNELGIQVYQQKTAGLKDTILIEIIEKILKQIY
jgi:hypothetical protein